MGKQETPKPGQVWECEVRGYLWEGNVLLLLTLADGIGFSGHVISAENENDYAVEWSAENDGSAYALFLGHKLIRRIPEAE